MSEIIVISASSVSTVLSIVYSPCHTWCWNCSLTVTVIVPKPLDLNLHPSRCIVQVSQSSNSVIQSALHFYGTLLCSDYSGCKRQIIPVQHK